MAELHAFYKATRETARIQSNISIERLRTSGDWPKLKAKAAATRHCTKFALHLASKHCDGSEHNLRRLAVVQCLNYFLISLKRRANSSPTRPVVGCRESASTFAICMPILQLRRSAKSASCGNLIQIFICLHMCEWTAVVLGNPRYDWTYMDEDAVGRMIEVSHSLHPRTMAGVALYKWSLWALL